MQIMALGIDGAAQLAALSPATFFRKRDRLCMSGAFAATPNMNVDLPRADSQISLLIPIESETTLYLDRRGTLRHLSHRGAGNIENQPLVEGLLQISIEWAAPQMTLTLRSTQGGTLQRTRAALLARENILNVVLNR